MIDVQLSDDGDPFRFEVTISEGIGRSRHSVTMSRGDYARLCPGRPSPEECIAAAFRFLLDREPKESILSHFDITLISRYFPEFDRELRGYLEES